jgi:LysR family transcriptional regulator, carnitine catabolism transcriptional activator
LGLRLFDRTNRVVRLTDAGRDLLLPVERLLGDLDTLLRHATDMAHHRRGHVTVAALPSVAAGALPRVIRSLTERYQGLVVRVHDVVGQRIVEMVKSGEADLGVGSLTRPDPDIESVPLFVDRLCAFVPVSHRLAKRRKASLHELVTEPLILTGRDSSARQIVERALEQESLAATVAQEAAYMSTAIGMVHAGLGVAVLPESARTPAGDSTLRAIPIHRPELTRQISLLSRRGKSHSPAADRFVALLKEHYAHASPKT